MLLFAIFQKSIFCCGKIIHLIKKHKVWTFWEILVFQSQSTANLLTLAIVKKFKTFDEKPSNSSRRNPTFYAFEKFYYCSIAVTFYSKLVTFNDFEKTKNFLKNPSTFQQKHKTSTFSEILILQSHSTANVLQFGETTNSRSDVNKMQMLAWTQLADIGKKVRIRALERKPLFQYFKNCLKKEINISDWNQL